MRKPLTAAERYEARYTRYALEALNGRPLARRRWRMSPWLAGLLILLVAFAPLLLEYL